MPVTTRSQKKNSDIAAAALKAKNTTYLSMYSGTPVPPLKPSVSPQLEDPKVNTTASHYKREFGNFSSHADFLSWLKGPAQPVLKKNKKQSSSSEPFRLRTF
jgi:hypothetical protein